MGTVYDYYKEKKRRHIAPTAIILAVLAVLVIGAVAAAAIYLEVLQLDEIGGFSSVFWTDFYVKAASFGICFILMMALLSLTNMFVIRNTKPMFVENEVEPFKIPHFWISMGISLVCGILGSNNFYRGALNFINSVSYGAVDPVFGQDVGYYMLQRPFLMSIINFASGMLLFVAIYTIAYYALTNTMIFTIFSMKDFKRKGIIAHIIVNLSAFFLIKAGSYKFSQEGILYNQLKEGTTGAGFVDVNLWKNFYMVAPVLLIIAMVLTFIFFIRGKMRYALISTFSYPILFVLMSVIATAVQALVVDPVALEKERPYYKNNMQMTMQAYNISDIKESNYDIKQNLNAEVISKNKDTVENIRVVDYRATNRSNNQLQSIRTYFSVTNGDIINYSINGKEIPVLIAAREIDKTKIPDSQYVNTMFKYTHGYGVVINPINRYTSSGQVDYILKDIELNSDDPSLKLTEPRIYYGEMTHDYVVVNATGINEIDKDVADETRYSGKGGIKLEGLNKLLFAIKNGDLNMMISGYIGDESKLLVNRDILQRVKMAAPFLQVDDDPYIVISEDGRLKWIIDAYTSSAYFPYSQYSGNANYIRNSVKAVVDAYNGKVELYVIDPNDPIVQTYKKTYPQIFQQGELPEFVKTHMRYPEKLYNIQAEIIKKYHFTPVTDSNVDVFFNNQDIWEIAKYTDMQNQNKVSEMEPYYNMIRLPGNNSSEELVMMSPYTFLHKDNMVAWLAARNSHENYGQFILYTFPKQRTVYGPNQVESQINQHPEISQQMTLWSREGSKVFKGNLLVIPIGESILYVEPIYTESTNDVTIPQVKEVVLGYQTGENMNIVYGTTLDIAMNKLFNGAIPMDSVNTPQTTTTSPLPSPSTGAASGTVTTSGTGAVSPAVTGTAMPAAPATNSQQVKDIYAQVKTAFNNGDWETFGRKMKELEQAINSLPAGR